MEGAQNKEVIKAEGTEHDWVWESGNKFRNLN